MRINLNSTISIKEASKDFSRVTRIVDKDGMAIIFKNNAPRYVVTEFCDYEEGRIAEDKEVMRIAGRIIDKHRSAFEEL